MFIFIDVHYNDYCSEHRLTSIIHISTLLASRLLSESRFSALFGLVQFVFVRLLWQPERTLGGDLLWTSIPSKGGGREGGGIDILNKFIRFLREQRK